MILPLLKWAGGKRWLVRRESWCIPKHFNAYIEPFLGGGSVFFAIAPKHGILNDRNKDLMNMYRILRDHPNALELRMNEHQRMHSKEYYYEIRSQSPQNKLERASRFLYLNRACWNGLYRVNRQGKFNVPIGTKTKIVYDTDDYIGSSRLLKRMKLRSTDYEKIIDKAEAGDFVFADPPYTVKHYNNGFDKYNEKIFSWDDQERLAQCVRRASDRGCMVAVTNADHESVRSLYAYARYVPLTRASILAADPTKRTRTTEALFLCNYA